VGLNSFYRIGGRKYDVGLHAMTNYVPRDQRHAARSVAAAAEDRPGGIALCPQKQSRVVLGGRRAGLRFTNDRPCWKQEIAEKFPRQIDGFRRLATSLGNL